MRFLLDFGRLQAAACAEESGGSDGRAHTDGLRRSRARNIVRRSVIDGCSDERQAEVDADAAVEVVHLDGDVPLVVIEGYDGVEFAGRAAQEDGIGGQWAIGTDALCNCLLDGGGDFFDLLAPQQAAVSAVRIEGGDGDARLGNAPLSEFAIREAEAGEDAVFGDVLVGIPEGDVGGEMDGAEAVRDKHGRDLRDARHARQDFLVADVLVSGQVDGLLVDGGGGDGLDASLKGESGSEFDGCD